MSGFFLESRWEREGRSRKVLSMINISSDDTMNTFRKENLKGLLKTLT